MEQRTKQVLFPIAFGVILYAVLMNFSSVFGFLNTIYGYFLPFLMGLVIAFILHVPMNGFENLLIKLFPRLRGKRASSLLALALTIITLALVIFLVGTAIVPALVDSIKSAYTLVQSKLPIILAWLQKYGIDTSAITDALANADIPSLINKISSGAKDALSVILSAAGSTVSTLASFGISLVIALYVLLDKSNFCRSFLRLTQAILPQKYSERAVHFAYLINGTYTRFLSGQFVEALILGCLMCFTLSIFRMPYAVLTAALTSVFAFIPYVGAFLSCFVGALLVLLETPHRLLIYVIVYLVTQFIENQFIYPHVVGGSVGLAPLWTLVSVLVGGKLFGLLGMIFFIPLASVAYTLLREWTQKRIVAKQTQVTRETDSPLTQ